MSVLIVQPVSQIMPISEKMMKLKTCRQLGCHFAPARDAIALDESSDGVAASDERVRTSNHTCNCFTTVLSS